MLNGETFFIIARINVAGFQYSAWNEYIELVVVADGIVNTYWFCTVWQFTEVTPEIICEEQHYEWGHCSCVTTGNGNLYFARLMIMGDDLNMARARLVWRPKAVDSPTMASNSIGLPLGHKELVVRFWINNQNVNLDVRCIIPFQNKSNIYSMTFCVEYMEPPFALHILLDEQKIGSLKSMFCSTANVNMSVDELFGKTVWLVYSEACQRRKMINCSFFGTISAVLSEIVHANNTYQLAVTYTWCIMQALVFALLYTRQHFI